MTPQIERILGILAELPPDDRDFVAPLLLPLHMLRDLQFRPRDQLVRVALSFFAAWPETVACKEVAFRLEQAARRRVPPYRPSTLDRILGEVLNRNGGRPLGWVQIRNIGRHTRKNVSTKRRRVETDFK